jgi:hypothetical protein
MMYCPVALFRVYYFNFNLELNHKPREAFSMDKIVDTCVHKAMGIGNRVTRFLDFFHRPVFLGVETQCFGNWICFRPQVRGGEDTYSVGPLRKS